MTLNRQILKDNQGNEIGVFLPMDEYQKIIELLEEVEDIKLYDEAKKEDNGERISLDDYINKRESSNG
ncbi:MAG: hypothetical protein K9J27_09655 [Bacteroidales bacterium]|nr:hypothetical protein [Bacteroidales bacterium]MCF8333965.1 hypothetical protein [Bacteroidales bacterium]